MLRTLIAGVSLSLLVAAPSAHAEVSKKDKAKAKALYDDGLRHFNLAEYDEAIKSWKESYLLTKAPLLLFNIGQAYRLSGDCTKATTFYDNYQREEPEPKNKDELDQAVQLCQGQGQGQGQGKSPAKPVDTKRVDPKPVVTTTQPQPQPQPVATKPVVTVATHDAEPGGGGEGRVDQPSRDPGKKRRTIGVVTGGVGVVLGAAGIVFAVQAHSKSSDLDGFTGEWTAKQQDAQKAGKRDVKLAWTLGGAGIAAIGIGTYLYLSGKHASESNVAIVPTDGGAQLAWGTQF